MAAPSHSATLRALAADLAKAPQRDIQAVLKDLGPPHRDRVEELLAAESVRLHRPLAGSASRASGGLSPWLADRLASASPAEGWAMTDVARDALKAVVRAIEFERGSRLVEPPSASGSLSFRRMLQALVASRVA